MNQLINPMKPPNSLSFRLSAQRNAKCTIGLTSTADTRLTYQFFSSLSSSYQITRSLAFYSHAASTTHSHNRRCPSLTESLPFLKRLIPHTIIQSATSFYTELNTCLQTGRKPEKDQYYHAGNYTISPSPIDPSVSTRSPLSRSLSRSTSLTCQHQFNSHFLRSSTATSMIS